MKASRPKRKGATRKAIQPKRKRATRAEMEARYVALIQIVAEQQPMSVRQVLRRADSTRWMRAEGRQRAPWGRREACHFLPLRLRANSTSYELLNSRSGVKIAGIETSLKLSAFPPNCGSGHIVSHIANGHVRHATAQDKADRQSTEVQQFP